MSVLNRWTRSAAALAAAAIVPLAVAATAGAAPARTATTTKYTQATYLQHRLGLPSNETDPAIETVTYDRFQWLLQQPGKFAFLIGDPAEDETFAARARDVEAAADAAGVKRVYWFDPNLSGSVTVGGRPIPNLDVRNPAGITSLVESSRNAYGRIWLSLIGQHLGNGIKATPGSGGGTEPGGHDATVTTAPDATVVNDYGRTDGYSTEVGDTSGGALYDYAGGDAPEDVQDSFFFVYDKDRTITPEGGTPQPAKIVSWVNLSEQTQSAATRADVTTAIGKAGTALAELDQFDWWKSEVNFRQVVQAPQVNRGSQTPVLTDADDADTWRINQITYPELVDLLEHATDADAVILFGGTWCPNTRPVLGATNKYAQENDVTVFNFDTVLDGANVGGGATSSSNPLQSRNFAGSSATATTQTTPTFLYGAVLDQYLTNIQTQYNPATNSVVTYFPGGDTSDPAKLTRVKKLQVPFLLGYRGTGGDEPGAGVTRQWIVEKDDGTYTEYMSQWWFTHPQPNQLGLSIPLGAPIWSTINAQLATFTWQTDPVSLYVNTATDADDAQFLVAEDRANVTYNAGNGNLSITSAADGSVVISPAALAAALTALGGSAPANYSAARTAYIAALTAETPNEALVANLKTVVGAWGVAQSRKNALNNAWGGPTTGGLSFGLNAVHQLDVFFGGLPGGVVSRRTVTANTVRAGTAPKITLTIANDYGRVPAGNVSLVVRRGGATVASATAKVTGNAVSFTLPVLAAGTYDFTLSYAGDDQIAGFTETGSLTVTAAPPVEQPPVEQPPPVEVPFVTPPVVTPPAPQAPADTKVTKQKVRKVAGSVTKKPTRKAAGRFKVTITTAKGRPKATGRVTIKLKKGKTTKTITGKLSRGTVTVKLPKLARGTWKVTITWRGDANYRATTVAGRSIKVTG